MAERDDVLEEMRTLCEANFKHAQRMSEQLESCDISVDTRPYAEQRRYSELAFNQLVAYLKAQGLHGDIPDPENDAEIAAAKQKHILKVEIEP